MIKAFGAAAAIVIITTISTVYAESISGRAYVIDADTVVVNGIHIRLKGVDAAELMTERGEHARLVMIKIVSSGPLTCTLTGEKTYQREVGYCTTPAGVDIGQAIIASGAALACPRYSTRYLQFERPEALTAQARAPYCLVR